MKEVRGDSLEGFVPSQGQNDRLEHWSIGHSDPATGSVAVYKAYQSAREVETRKWFNWFRKETVSKETVACG